MTMTEEKKAEPTTTPTNGGGGVAARLARPNILTLQPYRCARDDYNTGVLLDANENAFGPSLVVDDDVGGGNDDHHELERYPCPYQIPLKEAYAKYRGHDIQTSNIFVGVGSDEAIDLLMRIFCTPANRHGEDADSILITPPTYGMYKVSANVNAITIIEVPLTPDFQLRVPEILEAVTETTKLIFICSPGNPTSKAIPLEDMKAIASSYTHGLVVVDEAYVDFSTQGTALSLLSTYPNIVVLQTLSKAFGLAAIRCGFAIAHHDIIQYMNNVKAPYNVNKLTSQVAFQAITNHIPLLHQNIQSILEQREIVTKSLNELDFVSKVYPSDANFLLFRMTGGNGLVHAIYKAMADSGVVTRFRGKELYCDGCIRVTIGTSTENRLFIQLLKDTHTKLTSV